MKRSFRSAVIQHDQCHQERRSGGRRAQREGRVRTRGEGGRLHTQERGLRRQPPCPRRGQTHKGYICRVSPWSGAWLWPPDRHPRIFFQHTDPPGERAVGCRAPSAALPCPWPHPPPPPCPGAHLPALAPPDAIDGLGWGDRHHGGRAGHTVAPRGDDDGAHGHALGRAGRGAVVGGWRGHGGRLAAQ